tara:strand:+ start:7843 stop:10947 length:3105 start_codon:yes stop_codon:yes gene_type:complete
MNTRTAQLSFAGGEISPELFGRPDAVQYRTGAAQLKNWVSKPQGPVRTRPGFRHVALAGSAAAPRLVPFVYSTGQSLIMEIGIDSGSNRIVRLYTQGASVKWAVPFNLGDASQCVDDGNDTLVGLGRHGWPGDTQVKILVDAGGTLPTGISGSTTYYAHGSTLFTPRRFQLHTSSGGASLQAISGGSGYLRAFASSGFPSDWTTGSGDYTQGDLIYWAGGGGVDQGVYWCVEGHTPTGTDPHDAGADKWHLQPHDGTLEMVLPTSYSQEDLADLVWRQNGDIITLANNTGSYPLTEITRIGATTWRTSTVSLGTVLTAPTISGITNERGVKISMISTGKFAAGTSRARLNFHTNHQLAAGDIVYVENLSLTGNAPVLQRPDLTTYTWTDGFYVTNFSTSGVTIELRAMNGDLLVSTAVSTSLDTGDFYYSSASAETSQEYKVTAMDADGRESLPSAAVSTTNVLSVRGASNDISWASITGASRYRVYKKENGLFGYIGESDTTTFSDDNIAPDLGRTPPIQDTTITGANYPAAVGGHEQRLFLASTLAEPQAVWGSKPGSELDFTYTLPVQSDNRLKFVLDSGQAQTVRHIIGMKDLALLTRSGEFRVRAADDGGLTPGTTFARQEGYDGANSAQPVVVSNFIVYGAARGGHVRKLAYEVRRSSFESKSVSLRAAHLFSDYEVTDFALVKAPFPVVWARSTSGQLLGMTFVPEEEVEGWHQHSTAGTIESIASAPEGDEDVLYAAVARVDSDGNTVRTIERMQEFAATDASEAACLDAHTSTFSEGPASYSAQLRVDLTSVTAGATVTLTGRNTTDTSTQVAFDPQDVGKYVVVTSGGVDYRTKITSYTSNAIVSATLIDALPVSLAGAVFGTTAWRFANPRVYVPAWQAGTQLSVVANGTLLDLETPVASAHDTDRAYFDLAEPSLNVHAGLPYECDLQTLPMAAQIEALGMGRQKNLDRTHLRVFESRGLVVGPDADNLQPVSDLGGETLESGEKRSLVTGLWTEDGQLLVRQTQPFPATVLAVATRVSLGD